MTKKPALALANEPYPLRHFGLQKPLKRRLTNMQSGMFQKKTTHWSVRTSRSWRSIMSMKTMTKFQRMF